MTTSPVVRFEQVSKHFRSGSVQTFILENINFSIYPQETVSITGTSGCGKTTLLNLISQIDYVNSGRVLWNDVDVTSKSPSWKTSFRKNFMGLVFQNPNLLPELTVLENILLPVRFCKEKVSNFQNKAQKLLEYLQIPEKANLTIHHLSGGERQRVAIARALILSPQIVLADEPTGNLDETNGNIVINLLLDVCSQQKTSLILITHNETFAKKTQHQYSLSNKTLRLDS